MPNAIKYSLSAQTLALKKGNFFIGTGDVGKGPTSTTDYYNGITPPSGGYTIYLNKASQGPSIYTAANDSQLISLSNTIAGQTFATAAAALAWFATQTDKMIFNIDYPAIVTNGLVLNLDAGFTPSYPTTATTWYDVSSGGNNGTLTNGPTFSSTDGGSIVFDGVDDFINLGSSLNATVEGTISFWIKLTNTITSGYSGNQRPYGKSGLFECRWGGNASARDRQLCFDIGSEIGFNNALNSTQNIWLNTVWYNVAATYNSVTNSSTLYIQGVLDSTGIAGNPSSQTGQFNVGASNPSSSPINGRISNFLIYNRALTQSEVLQNYNAQKGRFGL